MPSIKGNLLTKLGFPILATICFKRIGMEYNSKCITLEEAGHTLKIYHSNKRDMVWDIWSVLVGTFFCKEYAWLDVKDKFVIDIGGYVGDSALYFMAHGAKGITVYEPSEESYGYLKKNVSENGFYNKIKVVNGALWSPPEEKRGALKWNKDSAYRYEEKSQSVMSLTLKQIVNKEKKHRNLVLKMDCEGAEYGLLAQKDMKRTLRSFTQIIMEYHDGYVDIKRLFEAAGFTVIVDGLMPRGHLFAIKL